jgi:hypothetical protein
MNKEEARKMCVLGEEEIDIRYFTRALLLEAAAAGEREGYRHPAQPGLLEEIEGEIHPVIMDQLHEERTTDPPRIHARLIVMPKWRPGHGHKNGVVFIDTPLEFWQRLPCIMPTQDEEDGARCRE